MMDPARSTTRQPFVVVVVSALDWRAARRSGSRVERQFGHETRSRAARANKRAARANKRAELAKRAQVHSLGA